MEINKKKFKKHAIFVFFSLCLITLVTYKWTLHLSIKNIRNWSTMREDLSVSVEEVQVVQELKVE